MKTKELIKNAKFIKNQECLNQEVSGIFYDSRKVIPNGIFVAIQGTNIDGNAFVQDAIERGASIVITEKKDLIVPSNVGLVVVENCRKTLAEISAIYYQHPSKKLKVVGITGTKGKTSTSIILKRIFESASIKCGLIGTIQYEVGQRIVPSTNTTPESVDLQLFFSMMVENGISHAVVEVSSHALDQGRIEHIHFDAGIFTNISGHEHLDYHKNFNNYLAAKLKFFNYYLPVSEKKNKFAIINIDDPYAKFFIKNINRDINLVTYGLSKKAEYHPESFSFDREGTTFILKGEKFVTRFLGKGNLYNCLAAIAAAEKLGVEIEIIKVSFENMGSIPGRMEFVNAGQPFTVVVDYAHTHIALEELLRTVRSLKPDRILLIFGCGGDRDRSKRPLMGKIAAKMADRVYITSDNPRNEDPLMIISDIYRAIPFWRKSKCMIIPDRHKAIETALNDAKGGDWVIIAGKGHEQYQIIKTVFHPFDDRKVAEEILRNKYGNSDGKNNTV